MMVPWILCTVLTAIVLMLLVKLHFMQKNLEAICMEFKERLSEDTNTLISVSSGNRQIKRLAAAINVQLKLLRKQRRRYLNGDRELKEAITNISHDLRTPLTAIYGYLDLLQKEETSSNVERYLSYIESRTQSLAELTEELFRYTVILSTEELTLAPVDVKAVLEESLLAFHAALSERGITPGIDMTEERVVRRLNQAALSRIFGNIVGNVLKYSDGDLEVRLEGDGAIVFTNAASQLDGVQVGKLFNRFFTVEAAHHSTGIGLAIAKVLVERMHGSITAQYHDGKLSVFILFPEHDHAHDLRPNTTEHDHAQ